MTRKVGCTEGTAPTCLCGFVDVDLVGLDGDTWTCPKCGRVARVEMDEDIAYYPTGKG